jgi:hypothetical protein
LCRKNSGLCVYYFFYEPLIQGFTRSFYLRGGRRKLGLAQADHVTGGISQIDDRHIKKE